MRVRRDGRQLGCLTRLGKTSWAAARKTVAATKPCASARTPAWRQGTSRSRPPESRLHRAPPRRRGTGRERCTSACCLSSIAIATRTCTRGSSASSATALITRGEFDRALVLHSEALEVFSARGDDQPDRARTGGARVHPVSQRQPRARTGHPGERVAAVRKFARPGRPGVRAASGRQHRGRTRAARYSPSSICAWPNGATITASASTARAC